MKSTDELKKAESKLTDEELAGVAGGSKGLEEGEDALKLGLHLNDNNDEAARSLL